LAVWTGLGALRPFYAFERFDISNAATFAAAPVTVAFDNFHVVADQIVCP